MGGSVFHGRPVSTEHSNLWSRGVRVYLAKECGCFAPAVVLHKTRPMLLTYPGSFRIVGLLGLPYARSQAAIMSPEQAQMPC